MDRISSLKKLHRSIVNCRRCPRLVNYCREVAREKRRAYREWTYWGKPVPSFGDPGAALLILGLAPAAHGANRTGRMFTGDSSGNFLYRALYETGFANQPHSRDREDGLQLRGCYITAAIHCAPPKNKPLPSELERCKPYLEEELRLLPNVRAILALGRIAFETYLRIVASNIAIAPRSRFKFAHGASFAFDAPWPRLFASYHPSRQNTQTGKLTPRMMRDVLEDVRRFLAPASEGSFVRQ